MLSFNGNKKHEWAEFAEEFLNMGAANGGWDKALEMELDLEVAANQKLNKLAWNSLTLSLEGEAFEEMDMIPDKNAYAVWQHLNRTYMPRNRKANDQKWKMKPKEEQCFKRQEEKGYVYFDLWNEDFEDVKVEDETEEAEELEDENREKEDKPLVEDNEDDPIREENARR